jgi:hypothetical protein
MRLASVPHTEKTGELTVFRAAVISTTELVLGRSPGDTAHAEVVDKLVAEFQKVDG